jgi:hypothetical protein
MLTANNDKPMRTDSFFFLTNQHARDLSSVWRLRNISRSLREVGTARTADGI